MRISFLPGELHLTESEGFYVITMQGTEILRTRSQRAATARFNELRREMETRFPARELTAEEKAEIFRKAMAESMLSHNSLGGRKKKTSAGSTRTFGG